MRTIAPLSTVGLDDQWGGTYIKFHKNGNHYVHSSILGLDILSPFVYTGSGQCSRPDSSFKCPVCQIDRDEFQASLSVIS